MFALIKVFPGEYLAVFINTIHYVVLPIEICSGNSTWKGILKLTVPTNIYLRLSSASDFLAR